jgi:hypothetical protein
MYVISETFRVKSRMCIASYSSPKIVNFINQVIHMTHIQIDISLYVLDIVR